MQGNLKIEGEAQMKRIRFLILALVFSLLFCQHVFAETNAEYEAAKGYSTSCPDVGEVPDSWNFFTCNCTSYVAWRLNKDWDDIPYNDIDFVNQYRADDERFSADRWSHARYWGHRAREIGIDVNSTPKVGAVGWRDSGEYGATEEGHVFFVEDVNSDGSKIKISEYNGSNGTHTYYESGEEDWIDASEVSGYIHFTCSHIEYLKNTLVPGSLEYWEVVHYQQECRDTGLCDSGGGGGTNPVPVPGTRADLYPDYDIKRNGSEISANCEDCMGDPVNPGEELEFKGQIKVANDDAGNWKRDGLGSVEKVEGTFFWKIPGYQDSWQEFCTEEYSISKLDKGATIQGTCLWNVPNLSGGSYVLHTAFCPDRDDVIWEEDETENRDQISDPIDDDGINCSRVEQNQILTYPDLRIYIVQIEDAEGNAVNEAAVNENVRILALADNAGDFIPPNQGLDLAVEAYVSRDGGSSYQSIGTEYVNISDLTQPGSERYVAFSYTIPQDAGFGEVLKFKVFVDSTNVIAELADDAQNWSGVDNLAVNSAIGLRDVGSPWIENGFGYVNGWSPVFARYIIDVNNDGKGDLVAFGLNSVAVAHSNGSGFDAVFGPLTDFVIAAGWNDADHIRAFGDVNGDGYTDLIGFGENEVLVSLNDGAGSFLAPSHWHSQFSKQGGWIKGRHYRFIIDVNGDGKDDILGIGEGAVYIALSTGSGFGQIEMWLETYFTNQGGWIRPHHIVMPADVDGDGLPDLVGFGSGGPYVALNTGTSFEFQGSWLAGYFGYSSGWDVDRDIRLLKDMNGDDILDIVGFANQGLYVSLGTGSSFGVPTQWSANFGKGDGWTSYRVVVDANNDGLNDIIAIGQCGVYVGINNGTSIVTEILTPGFGPQNGWHETNHPRIIDQDVSGDGKPDVIGFPDMGMLVFVNNL